MSIGIQPGEYYNFSVSHQVGAGGAKDALLRSKTWFEKLQGVLDTLKQDEDLALARKTIQQVESSAAGWRRAFAGAAHTAAVEVYRGPLEADVDLWSRCAAQWGVGPGFKVRVERMIRDWFEARTELNQKLETVMAALWEETVIRPLERLSDESARELPNDTAATEVAQLATAQCLSNPLGLPSYEGEPRWSAKVCIGFMAPAKTAGSGPLPYPTQDQ